jgi:hypothetical protein
MTETEKIMKRVLKKVPNAKMLFDSEKNLYIDVNGVNLSEEHLLPLTKDPQKAWEMADLSLKMTQNFNRTHPMRTEFYSSNDTKKRINRRRKKTMDFYGYYNND